MSAATKKNAATDVTVENPEAEVLPVPEAAPETHQEEILDNEMERLVPGPGEPLVLSDGTSVEVRPLKIKELFAAFKIISRGAAMTMGAMNMDLFGDSQEHFVETMVALLINAFPEADQEFCEFLRVIVDPTAPDGKRWTTAQREERIDAEVHLDQILLDNPDIGDAIDLLTVLISREAGDMQRLGKKVRGALTMFAKVQPKTPQKK